MAVNTPKNLRNKVMYQIFTRNFSEEGSFSKVREKLDDIKNLGIDIIWFMPIHPIGKVKRKGSLGSPYAISDYRKINPEFGTIDDFKALVDDIHSHGMKCIIDVVYNHTSPDSVLSDEHPEWFYHKEDGSFGNHVGDWTDIIDLDYSNKDLWKYQIDTLKMWAEIVDGFRCDVASLIPVEFWLKARTEVETVRPGCIWLAESVDLGFVRYIRSIGLNASSDSEIYKAFDICYDYDIREEFHNAFLNNDSLKYYTAAVDRQEGIYPDNYVKLRYLENHDMPRAKFLVPDRKALRNWTAFIYFQKGLTLIYAGQEYSASHTPSLFYKDTAEMSCSKEDDLTSLMKKLSEIKHSDVFTDSSYSLRTVNDTFIHASHTGRNKKAFGIFSTKGDSGCIKTDLGDGTYTNLITGDKVEVAIGHISSNGEPIIIITE